jgi:hypothetical protein
MDGSSNSRSYGNEGVDFPFFFILSFLSMVLCFVLLFDD